ncbi:MAG TPA: ABC transporter ATP-binding protein [Ilumatobacter sp.]|nr:ABC transporter ATP-binding protein [Ilumatobacter sp.]
MSAAIRVEDLHVRYGEVHAVRGVSFDVQPGEVYGLLGHNGAGKTSTVEVLEGHRSAADGTVSVLGVEPRAGGRAFRDRIGIVLQSSSVDRALSVREALVFYGGCYRTRRPVDEAIEMVGLTEKADARVGTLSGGQARRLDLALGIIGQPELLFLDEPTTGFDPVARRQSWELVKIMCQGGTTVLLTTHYLDEAEHLADRVGVMANGLLVAEGTPADLMAAIPDTTITFAVLSDLLGGLAIPADALVEHVSGTATVRIDTPHPTAVLAAITSAAVAGGFELDVLTVRKPTLEDVFLRIGSQSAEGGAP